MARMEGNKGRRRLRREKEEMRQRLKKRREERELREDEQEIWERLEKEREDDNNIWLGREKIAQQGWESRLRREAEEEV